MPQAGDTIPLSLQLFDGAEDKFPQAIVRTPDGVEISGSPFDLSHQGDGLYENDSQTMPAEAYLTATYKVYDEIAHTNISADHSDATDNFPLVVPFLTISECLDQIKVLLAQIQTNKVVGELIFGGVLQSETVTGEVMQDMTVLSGVIDDQETLSGEVTEETVSGTVEETETVSGEIDEDTIEGNLEGDC